MEDKPRFGIKHTPSHPYLMENVTTFLNWQVDFGMVIIHDINFAKYFNVNLH